MNLELLAGIASCEARATLSARTMKTYLCDAGATAPGVLPDKAVNENPTISSCLLPAAVRRCLFTPVDYMWVMFVFC